MAARWFSVGPGVDHPRRQTVTLASLAPGPVVFPDPHDGEEISTAADVGPSSRNEYIMVHHTGAPDAHLDKTTNHCEAGYDFFIRADGEIVVCPRWNEPRGSHAKGCNCKTTGIMLMDCFGGCANGNTEAPTASQECSLAHLIVKLGTPIEAGRLFPHRHCRSWNPCQDDDPTGTVCCGENLTTDATATHWSAAGDELVKRIIVKARNVKRGGCCFDHCPTPIAAMELPRPGRGDRLDDWSVGDLDYELYVTDAHTGFIADARRGGDLLERRTFVSTPSGVLATTVTKDPPVSEGDTNTAGIR